jgi:hypothetical protein
MLISNTEKALKNIVKIWHKGVSPRVDNLGPQVDKKFIDIKNDGHNLSHRSSFQSCIHQSAFMCSHASRHALPLQSCNAIDGEVYEYLDG